ncbi:MAG: hypothetical protein EXR64_00360 [Dehalococcoidia bacterium]|nr:hypothetical protein [Dehalococcoidia bacterium]
MSDFRRPCTRIPIVGAVVLVLVALGVALAGALLAPKSQPAASRASGTPQAAGPSPLASRPAASSDDPWDSCAAAGTIDRPDPRYLGDGTRAVIQDALAIAERRPQRFADPAARRVAIPWRCMDGAVWACDQGANLPCGAANQNREPTAAMNTYCAEHPDWGIPLYVSGHSTIFAWSCYGGRAVIDRQQFQVDARGFVANFWYRLERPRS